MLGLGFVLESAGEVDAPYLYLTLFSYVFIN